MGNWTEDFVRDRARQLWEAAGQPEGRDTEFWLQAEQEVGASAEAANGRIAQNPEDAVANAAVEAESGWVSADRI
jgi:hypothetical protein